MVSYWSVLGAHDNTIFTIRADLCPDNILLSIVYLPWHCCLVNVIKGKGW